ncbi:MAG: S8 family serine peptidase [Pseudomonadota bacterium]
MKISVRLTSFVAVTAAAVLLVAHHGEQQRTTLPANPRAASLEPSKTQTTTVVPTAVRPAPQPASVSAESAAAQTALPAGTQYNIEGLPVFAPAVAQPAPITKRVLTARQIVARQIIAQSQSARPGFSDHIVKVDAGTDIDAFDDAVRDIDGRVLRFMPEQRLASVRIPSARADALAELTGAAGIAADAELTFMSVPAKATANLPPVGTPTYTAVNTDIGVAVIDTGVAEHADLNVARHVHLSAPKTQLMNGTRDDAKLEALFVFDEGGNVAFDRAGDSRQHLYVTTSTEGVIFAPDEIDWSSLPLPNYRVPLTYFDLTNQSMQPIDVHYVGSADGQTTYRYATLQTGQTRALAAFPQEHWIITPQDSTERLAVMVDPLAHGAVTYGASASARWDDGTLQVQAGSAGSLPDTQLANACTAANAASIEMWVTPDNATDHKDILVGQSSNGQHFKIRQFGSRLQAIIGIQNGAVYAYSDPGSVVAGQPMHIIAGRSSGGATQLAVNGSVHWNTTINRSTPLVWSGDQTIELTNWSGAVDMLAVHCQSLTSNEQMNHYLAGPDAYASVNDAFGHGTHIASTIAGTGSISGGEYAGVAPGATIYDLRILDDTGRGTVADALAAIDWLLANAKQAGIRVVNLSVGKAIESSAADDLLVAGVEALVANGLTVVVSAGNYGELGNFYVTSPGNAPNVITVGALDVNDSACNSDDAIAAFSSQGPALYDHYLKPDLVAPGTRIIGATAPHGSMREDYPHRLESCANGRCSDEYFRLSGTSMAAAMTSGAAVLMLSQDSTLSPATIKARLMRSARKIDGDPIATGAGVLDITAALQETGTVTAAPTPRLIRASGQKTILIEDTASLWGNQDFNADAIWSKGFLWTQGYLWTDGNVYANGYLWTDGHLWANGYLWTDNSLWSNGFLWTDHNMMANGYLWTDSSNLAAQANDAGGSAAGGGAMCTD